MTFDEENSGHLFAADLQEPLRKIQAFGNLLEEEYGGIFTIAWQAR
jgi:light-regulated signal transduction histidine kinase (bacteriophytochrome)